MENTPPVLANKRSTWRWRALDILIVVVVLILIGISYLGWITPYRLGFHCDDQGLMYEFHGDSISLGILLSLVFLVPIIFIFLIEIKRHRPFTYLQKTNSTLTTASEKRVQVFLRCCVQVYMSYFYGLMCVLALVEFLKMSIGGLRPHFFYSCKPDFTTINCSEGFITNYTCTNKDNMEIFHFYDIFKSFPSGHAALSMHMSLFLCFYIHKQLFPWPTYFSTAIVQATLLYWAGFCSASRLMDHRHHWWDVTIGLILGIISSSYSAMLLWWIPLPCSTQCTAPSKQSLLNTRQSYESNYSTRRLLSSQASQTTDLGESISLSSPTEYNHVAV